MSAPTDADLRALCEEVRELDGHDEYLCRLAYRLTEAGRAALKVEKARSGAA